MPGSLLLANQLLFSKTLRDVVWSHFEGLQSGRVPTPHFCPSDHERSRGQFYAAGLLKQCLIADLQGET